MPNAPTDQPHSGETAAAMSANHIDPDVGVEIFILAPDGAEARAAS